MSVNGSFPVSLNCIMGAWPVLYHQPKKEADVGIILQITVQAPGRDRGDFLYLADSV